MKFLMIGVLGLVGVYLRYAINTYPIGANHNAAYATFLANTLGCLIAGIVFALFQTRQDSYLLSAILIGFCGGLTTFSGYNLEFLNQLNQGLYAKASLYFIAGPLAGLLAIILGYFSTLKMAKFI